MKVIIAGTRTITNMALLKQAIQESKLDITQVVSGGAHGVDRLGEDWAIEQWSVECGIGTTPTRAGKLNYLTYYASPVTGESRVRLFPADWSRFGISAGRIRNIQMAEYADALIALWDGKSRGTFHMINTAAKAGIIVYTRVVCSSCGALSVPHDSNDYCTTCYRWCRG